MRAWFEWYGERKAAKDRVAWRISIYGRAFRGWYDALSGMHPHCMHVDCITHCMHRHSPACIPTTAADDQPLRMPP